MTLPSNKIELEQHLLDTFAESRQDVGIAGATEAEHGSPDRSENDTPGRFIVSSGI